LRGAEQRSAELSVVPVTWQGAPALAASLRDNTERRKAEAQLAAADRLASLGALVTSVAHDINNPLAAMIFNLELAAQAALAQPGLEELQQLIADAREAAGHVRAVVRDLRIFARASEDQDDIADVRRVVDTTLRMTNNQTRHRARLVVTLDDVPEVRANESRLGQVLLNLVVNAAQAIPEGAAPDNCIGVSARRRDDWVEIAVSDTGCGMTPALQNRLFTPFFTSKPADQGTGLGLSICQRIVESYGGKMEVESRVGVGSTFRVLLPMRTAPATLCPAPAVVVREGHRRGRILVIDDDVMVGNAFARAMTSEHAVQVAYSAQDGLAILRTDSNFDVVLCDVMMPEMTGTELFERLEREMPELAKKVVFFTGGAFTPKTRELLARLPNRKLDKPIDVDVLSALIAELVDGRA
jgi:nitrogen-specific signal transduction histidine kinase/CheY-like chemotaxis protein